MYFEGKKYPPSSHPSMKTNVLPGSWFSKLKPRPTNTSPDLAETQYRGQPDFLAQNLPLPVFPREARFYSVDGDDDDMYWRLSFHEEQNREHAKGIAGIPPTSSSSDDEAFVPVPAGFTSFGPKLAMPRRKDWLPRNSGRRRLDEPIEKVIFPVEMRNKVPMKKEYRVSPADDSGNFGPSPVGEKYEFLDETSDESGIRKKTHQTKIKQKTRVASNYSPQWEHKVRAVEELKKERMRPRRKETKSGTIYDCFAEVKASYNPQEDFRQSMVEMICEQGIRRPEELEELLACYLTLNGDEYHDLIIRVFQEVWFELSGAVC